MAKRLLEKDGWQNHVYCRISAYKNIFIILKCHIYKNVFTIIMLGLVPSSPVPVHCLPVSPAGVTGHPVLPLCFIRFIFCFVPSVFPCSLGCCVAEWAKHVDENHAPFPLWIYGWPETSLNFVGHFFRFLPFLIILHLCYFHIDSCFCACCI